MALPTVLDVCRQVGANTTPLKTALAQLSPVPMVARARSTIRDRFAGWSRPDPLAVLGCLLVLGAFWLLGSPVGPGGPADLDVGSVLSVGLAAGLGVCLAVLAAGPLAGFVVGHVLLLVVRPDPEPAAILVAEAALGTLLLAAVSGGRGTDGRARWTTRLLTALTFVALGAFLVVVAELLEPLWAVATVLVGAVALCAYALHRYELVTLGLVGEAADE